MKNNILLKLKQIDIGDKIPPLKGIFIIPREELHDSGYKTMYVVGHTDYENNAKDYDYYLLASYSDVIDFVPVFNKLIKQKYNIPDLHLDIDPEGIIHIWTNSNKKFKCWGSGISSCTLEVIE